MSSDAFGGLSPCVHCGFCLQACPTFLATGDEADGPRGRIALMQGLVERRVRPGDRAATRHLDRCLGCRACEPVCPSGVRYGPALEATRSLMARHRPLPVTVRMTNFVLGTGSLRRPLLAVARGLRPLARLLAGDSRLRFPAGMLAATRPAALPRHRRDAAGTSEPPGAPPPEEAVALFRGCIMDGLFSHVHDATCRVLRTNGYAPTSVPGQVCCGALHAHAGQHEAAAALARQNVAAFAAAAQAPVAVNSAGCGAMLKSYGELLATGPEAEHAAALAGRVRDVAELLAARGPVEGAPLSLRVAHDPPCHQEHAQRLVDEPEALLAAVPELTVVRHLEAGQCCGSAGSYSLSEPALSRAILRRKVQALLAVRPDVVATGNPGCVMQIGAGMLAARQAVPVMQPIELLDHSYRRAGFYGN